jgi:phosphatidylinositol alpha-1,6-mannosyltransferase
METLPPDRAPAEILLVSKPLEPPWNDGSKTLARELACAMERYHPIALGTRAGSFVPPRGRIERIYGGARAHALASSDALRVLGRLARGRPGDLWHFFFQPHPRTSILARALVRARRRPTVHTVASAPRADHNLRLLFFADRTVVLSRATEARLRNAGIERVVRIPPASRPVEVPDAEQRRAARLALGLPTGAPLVVFPGDLERGEGARLSIEALDAPPLRQVHLAMAYRQKSPAVRRAESELRALAERRGVAKRVHWIGETERILSLLGAADVVALPSRDLGAKVDLPIALIEAMWQARPVIVARESPASELAEQGGAAAIACDRDALASVLAALLDDATARAEAGARARAAAEARYDPRGMASRYEALYDELLG